MKNASHKLRQQALLLIAACLLNPGTSFAKLPAGYTNSPFNVPHVPDQLLVQFKAGFSSDFIEARLSNLGTRRLSRFRAVNVELVQVPGGLNLERFAQELARESMIAFVEPNYRYKVSRRPNDANYSSQWQLENTGGNFIGGSGAGIPGADLNMVAAWDIEALGSGSRIAIIDDAVEITHEDLAPNVVSGGKCFESGTDYCAGGPNNPNPSASDQDHGTLVAGAALARGDNVTGVASPAWRASLLAYKTDLTSAAITAAINDAISSNAHIINMSFGGPTPSQSTRAALAAAQAAGILAITSAGNADANNDRSSAHYPSNYDLPNVIAVAASDGYDDIAGFSQWGAFIVELAAPGSRVQTTAVNDSYRSVSGTSFSSPLVAGVAALIRAHTGATGNNAWKQTRAHLLYGGVNGLGLGGSLTPGRDRKSIPGRVQAGRLDAERALQGPPGGVVVINGFTVDDSATGNGNGLLDANESADLVIELENVWSTETNVIGTLVPFDSSNIPNAFESGQLTADQPTQTFGSIAQDQKVTARFPVTLGNVTGNEHYFLTLQLQSDSGPLPDRYFMIEIGTLQNGVQVTQSIQRLNFDEFHAWHIDVPPGASNLVISTTADNPTNGTCRHSDGLDYPASIDIDLLVRYNAPPDYAIALDPPEGDESFFVDPLTEISGNCGGHETVTFPNPPRAGTYHIVVVNFDQVRHDYTLVANFDAPQEGSILFDQAQYATVESDGFVNLSVSRTGGAGAVSIDYATRDSSATSVSDYTASSGTLSWNDGETGSKTFQVSTTDDGVFEPDEQFFVDLSNPTGGATLGSPSTATVTITDDDNPGELGFTSAAYQVTENGLVATIGVSRTNGNKGLLTVNYTTMDGTASAGADYQAANGTLVWMDGETSEKFFDIPIIEDPMIEADETVLLAISGPTPAVVLTRADAVLTIDDNDDPGSVSFEQAGYSLSETDGNLTVTVNRNGGDLAGNASVDYATADLTATAGGDYQATSGTLSWLAGEGGAKTFVVVINDDSVIESNESFSLNLSNPSSGLTVSGPGTINVEILDDDDPGQLQFATASQSINEGSASLTVTVNRAAGAKGAVGVSYSTSGGSAISGTDFTAVSGNLVWADGDTAAKSFTVSITNDSLVENSESFTIALSSPTNGARLGTPSTLTATIIDNDRQPVSGGGGGGALGWLGLGFLLMTMSRRRTWAA